MILIIYLVFYFIILKLSPLAPATVTRKFSVKQSKSEVFSSINKQKQQQYRIVFKSPSLNITLAECLLKPSESVFKCNTTVRAIFCKLKLNMNDLWQSNQINISSSSSGSRRKLSEFAAGRVRSESKNEVFRYGIFPFRLSLDEDEQQQNEETISITLFYAIPIFGSWNVLALYYERVAHVFGLDLHDVSCYSKLIDLLNESSSSSWPFTSRRLKLITK